MKLTLIIGELQHNVIKICESTLGTFSTFLLFSFKSVAWINLVINLNEGLTSFELIFPEAISLELQTIHWSSRYNNKLYTINSMYFFADWKQRTKFTGKRSFLPKMNMTQLESRCKTFIIKEILLIIISTKWTLSLSWLEKIGSPYHYLKWVILDTNLMI